MTEEQGNHFIMILKAGKRLRLSENSLVDGTLSIFDMLQLLFSSGLNPNEQCQKEVAKFVVQIWDSVAFLQYSNLK